jgi:hypothetical protein
VVYRNRNDEVKFLEINPVTARLIALLQDNETFTGQDALDQISRDMPGVSADVIRQGGLAALDELQQYGIILGCDCSA